MSPRRNSKQGYDAFVNVTRHRVVVTIGGERRKLLLGDEVTPTNERELELLQGNPKLRSVGKEADKLISDSRDRRAHKAMNSGDAAFPATDDEPSGPSPAEQGKRSPDGDQLTDAQREAGAVGTTTTSDLPARGKSRARAKSDTGTGNLEGRTVKQLTALARERGVTVKGRGGKRAVKADYVKALRS